MFRLFLFIILFLYNSSSSGKKLEDIKSHCISNTCSKVIKKINVGKFYFKARNCETKDYRKCQIWFGTPKNKLRAGWVKYYRLINGPMPLKLNCIMGQPIWYQDLAFPNEFTKNYRGIKTLKEFNFQNKEKVYFNRPANETFKFFSSRDNSFGILFSKRDRNEKKKNNIYIFDTETEKMRKIESECS